MTNGHGHLSYWIKAVSLGVGVITLLGALLAGMGQWWEMKFNEGISPLQVQLTEVNSNIGKISLDIERISDRQEKMRTEIQANAEQKVDKKNFSDQMDKIDNRIDVLEINKNIQQQMDDYFHLYYLHDNATKPNGNP